MILFQFFVAHVEDEDKNILLKGKRYDNIPENIVELAKQFPNSKVVVEATRNWQWLVWGFQNAGCDIIMAHPFRTKAIAAAKIKTDSICRHPMSPSENKVVFFSDPIE